MDVFDRPASPLAAASDESVKKSLGAHCIALRSARGLTQGELADRAGLAADTIRRIERGTFSPTFVTLDKLARALRLPASEFIAGYEQRERDIPGELAGMLVTLDESLRDDFLLLMSSAADLVTKTKLPPSSEARELLSGGPQELGEHVRRLRRARGLSQAKLAELAGFSADTVRRIEHGLGSSFSKIEALSLAMGLPLSVFFESQELRETRSLLPELEWIERLEPSVQLSVLRVLDRLRVMLMASQE